MTSGRWERRSLEVIRQVDEQNPTATDAELRFALRAAYPFGERHNWPYRVWLTCVRRHLESRDRRRTWADGAQGGTPNE